MLNLADFGGDVGGLVTFTVSRSIVASFESHPVVFGCLATSTSRKTRPNQAWNFYTTSTVQGPEYPLCQIWRGNSREIFPKFFSTTCS